MLVYRSFCQMTSALLYLVTVFYYLPIYSTESQAKISLLKSIKDEIKCLPPVSVKDDDVIHDIAKGIG